MASGPPVIVVRVWEQGTATPMQNLQHECSRGGNISADSPALSVTEALLASEMFFRLSLARTVLAKEQAAGTLQLGL